MYKTNLLSRYVSDQNVDPSIWTPFGPFFDPLLDLLLDPLLDPHLDPHLDPFWTPIWTPSGPPIFSSGKYGLYLISGQNVKK